MTDTNQLPPLPEPEGVIVVGTQALRGFTADQMRAYALQALAQVHGEAATVAVDHFDNAPNTEFTNRIHPPVEIGTKLYTTPQPAQATQAEVTPEEVMRAAKEATAPEWQDVVDGWHMGLDLMKFTSLILALRPAAVPMTDEVFDLICNAIDKADTISMEGDYMLDSDDCIAVVRVMQALLSAHHGITAQAKKETP